MHRSLFLLAFLLLIFPAIALAQPPAAARGSVHTTTYEKCIAYYRLLDAASPKLTMLEEGPTDAGYPLHLVLYSNRQQFQPSQWDREKMVVILINNGIHPGEPDGIEASMLLMHHLAKGLITIPDNVVIAVIPAYNIGGMLNRSCCSRVNQNGPVEYGFRGNAQNLDLNRDFTKCDSKEAASFAHIFHFLDPNILIDTHVSDGADYRHTMTLLSTQYDKLGGTLGSLLRNELDPELYMDMAAQGDTMIPYVNVEESTPDKGWTEFYDPPRFSSGYAALWQCIAFVPETHMLKPFAQRVNSTYRLLQVMLATAAKFAPQIIAARTEDRAALQRSDHLYLDWIPDTAKFTSYLFNGYTGSYKTSEVTGAQRLYYDHAKPLTIQVPVRNFYHGKNEIAVPKAYILPQAWAPVTERLQQQGVAMQQFRKDTSIRVSIYQIDAYDTRPAPYEKHYKHTHISAASHIATLLFRAGDWYIPVNQPAKRFLMEMLEPTGEDSYFAWNFFDGVLQQKEGYSDYRWEDVAADFLANHPDLRKELTRLTESDKAFTPEKQLRWVYEQSPWFEPFYKRYPVFRIE